jgi:hypothetical protein
MNSKIKSASIVLTGGVLLGWGSSAALAANVVGVGMYGTEFNPLMAEDPASDAVSYDENTGYVTINYGSRDGISLDNTIEFFDGSIVAVNIDSAGSGYDLAEDTIGTGVWQVVDNTGNTGRGAEWGYEVDDDIGYYDIFDQIFPRLNAAGNYITELVTFKRQARSIKPTTGLPA